MIICTWVKHAHIDLSNRYLLKNLSVSSSGDKIADGISLQNRKKSEWLESKYILCDRKDVLIVVRIKPREAEKWKIATQLNGVHGSLGEAVRGG